MQRMELGQAQDKPLQGNLQEREKFLMQGFMETSSGQGLMDTLITLVYNCELGKGAQLRHVYENTKGKAFFYRQRERIQYVLVNIQYVKMVGDPKYCMNTVKFEFGERRDFLGVKTLSEEGGK